MPEKDFKVVRIFEVVHATSDAEEVVKKYSDYFNIEFTLEWELPWENVKVRAAEIGDTQLHVISATAESGPVHSFISRKGEGIHHICFEVVNMDSMIEHLRKHGVRLVPDSPVEVGNFRYIFVHPSSMNGVLIELVEKRSLK